MIKGRTIIKVIAFNTLYLIFQLFPIKKKYILFNCNNGKNFDGNPRAIFDSLIEKKAFKDFTYIITKNKKFTVSNNDVKTIYIRYMSVGYLFYLAVSKYWVVNVNMYSGVNPRRHQIYLQTWHGTPLKKIGNDIIDDSRNKEKIEWCKDSNNWTYFISNSVESDKHYVSAFKIGNEKILNYGLPRNDKFGLNRDLYNSFRKRLNIKENQRVILYAPTYRDDGTKIHFNFNEFSNYFGNKVFLLVNFHRLYEYDKYDKYPNIEFNQKLTIDQCMEVSDGLITDYSSVFFDYSMLDKPMFFYAYDLNKYMNNDRGMYYDYKKFVPGNISYDMKHLIENIDDNREWNVKNNEFSKTFNSNYLSRDATEKVIRKVFYSL